MATVDSWWAVCWLGHVLSVVLPLAASAQVGRCLCRRAIPWERAGWANPCCYVCMEEDANDRKRRGKLMRVAHATITITVSIRDHGKALLVSDNGRAFDGDELCDDDLMYGTARDAAAERIAHYKARGYKVKLVLADGWPEHPIYMQGLDT